MALTPGAFGKYVRKEREHRGWSREELSGRSEISTSRIEIIERDGGTNVTFEEAVRLADALTIATSWLLLAPVAEEQAIEIAPARWLDRLGPVFTTPQLTQLLGIDVQGVARFAEERSFWGLSTDDDLVCPVYPVRQFASPFTVRAGLPEILRVFDNVAVTDWTLASWLVSPQPSLDGRDVLEWLEEYSGDPESRALHLAERTARAWSRRLPRLSRT